MIDILETTIKNWQYKVNKYAIKNLVLEDVI